MNYKMIPNAGDIMELKEIEKILKKCGDGWIRVKIDDMWSNSYLTKKSEINRYFYAKHKLKNISNQKEL